MKLPQTLSAAAELLKYSATIPIIDCHEHNISLMQIELHYA